MKQLFFVCFLPLSLHAGEVSPAAESDSTNPWSEDFDPETSDERVDTDTATDEDVIIMEEDEDSEHVPGNADNETG